MIGLLIAEAGSNTAVWAAFGAVAAAFISAGLAYLTNRKRNPNLLMDTFIREVGADNDRLRGQNEEYAASIAALHEDLRKMKAECEEEIKAVRDECTKRENELKQQMFQLQIQMYNIQKGQT